jgi:hypothetical protein
MLPDYSGVAEATPENIGRDKLLDPLANTVNRLGRTAYSGATLPGDVMAGRADVSTPEGFARTQDLAGLAMTGGTVPGPPGMTLTSGVSHRPPRAIGGYVGQSAPLAQDVAKDTIGTHITTSPNVAVQDSLWPSRMNLIADVRPSTTPVVADVRHYLKYPRDPGNWNDPKSVVDFIQMGKDMGLPFPAGVLSGMESAAKQTGGLKENLIPMLKEKGYDAIKYPRDPGDPRLSYSRPNSMMVFDPDKVKPRYSPEGQEIIKARGILEPDKNLIMDEGSRAWMNASQRMKNVVNDLIVNGPGGMSSLSLAERREAIRLLTETRGKSTVERILRKSDTGLY